MKISEITPNMMFGKLKVVKKLNDSYKLSIIGLDVDKIKKFDDTYDPNSEKKQTFIQVPYFECICDCGKVCDIRGDLLIANLRTSCGCNTLSDNIAGLNDILIQHQVNFQTDYDLFKNNLRTFHFAIFDENNILLGLIDIRPEEFNSRIGNEDTERVKQRNTIYKEKINYCVTNRIKYLILSTLPVFYENWNNTQLTRQEICNQTWQRVKNQINEAFNLNEEIHWYREEAN